MRQIEFFDGSKPFKINNKIRLIELFAGYGSQSLALKYLGVPFERYKIAEWAIPSIQAYKDLHSEDNTDYSRALADTEIYDYLFRKQISADYNKPMTYDQIKRLGSKKARKIYNNIIATHNLVSVTQITGKDLEIVDTDKFTYIMTYSFPCQDLSLAGKGKGMEKGSGTRSSMLWEVERLLSETVEKPRILLMENVPDVIGTKNISHFAEWIKSLEELGYKNYWKVLNAADFGIPQSRKRCFMVSILGDYVYEFPQTIPLDKRLKDLLQKNVPEKYYLPIKTLKMLIANNAKQAGKGNGFRFEPTAGEEIAHSVLTRNGQRPCDNYILSLANGIPIKNKTKKGHILATDGDGIDISSRMEYHRGTVQKGKSQTLTTSCNVGVLEWTK